MKTVPCSSTTSVRDLVHAARGFRKQVRGYELWTLFVPAEAGVRTRRLGTDRDFQATKLPVFRMRLLG